MGNVGDKLAASLLRNNFERYVRDIDREAIPALTNQAENTAPGTRTVGVLMTDRSNL